ncbi:MAG: DUF4147 domain-containing protein [Anaerolineales bacterium]|nr:DUF4147 domain-containing protein [Anaerolineales bacterium]
MVDEANWARRDLEIILRAALAAVDPAAATRRALRAADLAGVERVFIVGAGKAGVAMARAAAEVVGPNLAGGVMAVPAAPRVPEPAAPTVPEPAAPNALVPGLTFIVGGHPLPSEGSLAAGRAIADLLRRAEAHDLVLALISGGGSALLELPVDGVSLADLQRLTDLALRSGAPIEALNRMRWRVSQLKGGGLLRLAAPARVLGLVLSDVVGNPLEIIASGPTIIPAPSGETAWEIAQRFGLSDNLPEAIRACLQTRPEPAAAARVENRVIGSNRLAGEAALAAASTLGYDTRYLGDDWQGEARDAGRRFASEVFAARAVGRVCLVAGGETTVRVRGAGRGGRNQELALAAALEIAGQAGLAVAGFGTDGIDGPTDAAGALVTGETVQRARELGLDPWAALAANDTYPFHQALGTHVTTGPTGTNVNDLLIGLVRGS